jgi:hypothetical protein
VPDSVDPAGSEDPEVLQVDLSEEFGRGGGRRCGIHFLRSDWLGRYAAPPPWASAAQCHWDSLTSFFTVIGMIHEALYAVKHACETSLILQLG